MIDWEFEAYPVMGDLVLVPIMALMFPIVRFLLDRLLLEYIFPLHPIVLGFYRALVHPRRLLRMGKLLLLDPPEGSDQRGQKKWKKRNGKFKESAWKCLYFLSAELFGLAVLYNESWFTDTQKFWIGPGDQVWPDQKVKTKLKILYMYAAGFFTYSFFATFFWETRRSDFLVTAMHHVATVVLITLSYMLRFARVGSVVLAIHDASDVILEFSKMLKYIGYDLLPSITFIIFVISWIALRLIYFPIWVIWSTSYEVLLTLDKRRYRDGPIYYYVFNTLLVCLFILNIYWWILIYRVLVKQIRSKGKVGEDVRSDSEEEDEKED